MPLFRVRTVFTGVAGTPWYSNIFYDAAAGYQGPDASAAVNAFWTSLRPLISNLITIDVEDQVAVIEPATGQITDYQTAVRAPYNGTLNEGIAPAASQGLITLRTGVYRSGRPVIGKCFVPGLGRTQYDVYGRLLGTAVTSISTAANTLRTNTAGGYIANWAVYSRPRRGQLGTPIPGLVCPVSSVTVSSKPGVLRSRRD